MQRNFLVCFLFLSAEPLILSQDEGLGGFYHFITTSEQRLCAVIKPLVQYNSEPIIPAIPFLVGRFDIEYVP